MPGPGGAARQVIPQMLQRLTTAAEGMTATTPHQIAALHLERMLMAKQARHIARAAGVGAFGGALVGLPLGGLVGAYRAGERTVGPMGAG
jgi:ABC-type nitrate/sulfonate/bicarbonate transport system permease component